MIAIYHDGDADGALSAAIASHAYRFHMYPGAASVGIVPRCEVIRPDWGGPDDVGWLCVVMDHAPTKVALAAASANFSSVVVYDHHTPKLDVTDLPGRGNVTYHHGDLPTCKLVWQHLGWGDELVGELVDMIADADQGRDGDGRAWVAAMRLYQPQPFQAWAAGYWLDLWSRGGCADTKASREGTRDTYLAMGRAILAADAKAAEHEVSEGVEVPLLGTCVYAINRPISPVRADAVAKVTNLPVVFYWRVGPNWQLSFRAGKSGVDVAALAKQLGGGGHPAAAGARVEDLPF